MVRVVLYLFLAILLITLLRSVLGVVGKGVSALFGPEPPGPETPSGEEPRLAGELKRDPVCGVYISAASSIKRTVHGEVVHFCSPECSEKYKS
jgi:YHS domain-containing protein